MGRVAVVLITWNSAAFLPRCLEALSRQTVPGMDLVVVDNASRDESIRVVRELAPRTTTIIRNDRNLGFAAAANQGIRACGESDLVALLNPDALLQPDYLRLLIEALEKAGRRFGSATGKLLRGLGVEITPTGRIDSCGIRMTRSGRHFDLRAGLSDPGDDAPQEVFGVSGAAALYRREFLDDVAVEGEWLDEDFFAYREDADLAWRGRLRGWRAVYVPGAVAWHVRRVSPEVRRTLPPELNCHSVKNRFLLRLKNAGPWLILRNLPATLARDLVVLGATLTVERSSLPAWRWLWNHRKRILAKRRTIQARRLVSDREISRWFRSPMRPLESGGDSS